MALLNAAIIFASVLVLWFVSDIVVESAKRLARGTGISPFVIGVTVASIGTSLPEIGNSIAAGIDRMKGLPTSDFAVGNIISANFGQITLMLGIVALFATLHFSKKELIPTLTAMLSSIIILFLFSLDGVISRLDAIMMILIYAAYIIYVIRNGRDGDMIRRAAKEKRRRWFILIDLLSTLGGLFVIIIFSKFIVDSAVVIANGFNMSTYLIGFLVGIGTSLPELTVSLRSALKGSTHFSIGNLLGSNITDPLLSLGSGALISDLVIKREILLFDIPFWIFSTIIAVVLLSNHLNKKRALILFALYILFLYLKIVLF